MKRVTKSELTDVYFNMQLNRFTTLTSSELNLSAILAGFALGAVVALLFVDTSNLVRAMFVLSITASWIFMLSTLYHTLILNGIQDTILYLDNLESSKEKYIQIAKINGQSTLSSLLFLVGLLCFSAVLICACFMFSSALGFITLSVYVPLLVLIFIKGSNLAIENKFIDFEKSYEELPEITNP